MMVSRRVESLRNPTSKSFEDVTPDGRCYQVQRRRAAAGGTVTVMTDVTEQKRAEQELASKEAELHVALDNMPGGLVYTDENLNIVFCNDRFREMYPVPADLLRPGHPIAVPAPPRDPWLLRQRRRGDDGRAAGGKPAPSDRQELRGHHAGRSMLSSHASRAVAGGTVTVMTDVTEQKRAEQALIEAKQRLEEANASVTEKNRMLEALSSKLSKYLSPQIYEFDLQRRTDGRDICQAQEAYHFLFRYCRFTETTDQLEAEELTDVLNQYLTEMSKIALAHGATIDKYIGDAMLLFFGDPETRGYAGGRQSLRYDGDRNAAPHARARTGVASAWVSSDHSG